MRRKVCFKGGRQHYEVLKNDRSIIVTFIFVVLILLSTVKPDLFQLKSRLLEMENKKSEIKKEFGLIQKHPDDSLIRNFYSKSATI